MSNKVPKILWWELEHLPQMLAMQRVTPFGDRLDKKSFLRQLSQRNAVGQVLLAGKRVVAYIIYEVWDRDIHITSFSAYDYISMSILLKKILEKADAIAPTRVTIETRETCVNLQLLLRRMGFQCYKILTNWYEDTNESSFLFENVQFLLEKVPKTEVPHLDDSP
jgi:hypothetical protein